MYRHCALFFLGAFALLWLTLSPKAATAGDGIEALKFVPSETMLIATINLEHLRTSTLYADGLAALRGNDDIQSALEMLDRGMGFRLERDVDTLIIALPPDVDHTQNFLIIAEGSFDESRFVAFSKSQGAAFTQRTHRGVPVYELDREAAIAFTKKNIIFGTPNSIDAAIDTSQKRYTPVLSNPKMKALIDQADVSKDIWFVLELPEAMRDQLAKESPLARGTQQILASISLQRGVAVRMDIVTDSDATASTLSDLLRGGLSQASRSQETRALGIDRALKDTKVQPRSDTITVLIDLTEGELRRLFSKLSAP